MLRIFISYSWKDLTKREALLRQIEQRGFEAVWDQKNILAGDDLNQGIINMLNSCHIVIACLTQESLASYAVREELTRAHHQAIRIYPIVQRSVKSNLPWFLQAPLHLQFETDEELVNAISKLLESIENDYDFLITGEAHKIIQDLHNYIKQIIKRDKLSTSEGIWIYELAIILLDNIRNELKWLSNTHHYTAIISNGANFLMRAKPLFEKAKQVYAVSIDTVSSFWVSKETLDQRQARDYLTTQPENTMRLFVFSNPDNAHYYVTMLNIHARKYGTKGRVFLCSKSSYRKIVDECAIYQNDHDMFNCDFAIIEYGNKNGLSVYKATLDREFFNIKRSNSNKAYPVLNEDEIRRIFAELRSLEPGEIHSHYGIMRWEIDLQQRQDEWASKLIKLFDSRQCDALHLVFFTEQALGKDGAKEGLRSCIRNVKLLLEDLRDKEESSMILKDVWFGESRIVNVRDHKTGGRITNDESKMFPYLLLMRFQNPRSLKEWYEHAEHSDVRRSLFENFDPRFKELYEAIDKIIQLNPDSFQIARMYEEIEGFASNFMKRRDYSEGETIYDVVNRKPFRPKIHFP